MSEQINIFNKSCIIRGIKNSQKSYSQHNFILQWAAKSLVDRIGDIKRNFKRILILSPYESEIISAAFIDSNITIVDLLSPIFEPSDLIKYGDNYDMIISLSDMHRINDLPGVLLYLRKMLKPDGVFLAAFAGGETLYELRSSLMHAEINIMGGASPRIFPFINKQQAGDLLNSAGFSLPVIDSDILSISYRDIFHLMADLRGMGVVNALNARHKFFTPSKVFFKANEYYLINYPDIGDRIKASFEIIFMIGWAPHENQPKPLRRGSAKISLIDALK